MFMQKYCLVQHIPQQVFRMYDIRGIVDEEFTDNSIFTIGVALGTVALAGRVSRLLVGRDGRISGPHLSKALIAGIIAAGCSVDDLGDVTTPMLYYAVENSEFRSGVMLSGSHNPPNYNGLKIMMFGRTWYGEDIQSLWQMIEDGKLQTRTDQVGKVEQIDIVDNYLEYITRTVKLSRTLRVVVDCGNGIGGKYVPTLLEKMGCEVTELYCEVDGNFPNHQPDPSQPKNMQDLVRTVLETKADVGLAFDGDADRVGVVTEDGKLIVADRLLLLLALDLLKRKPGATIVYDVKCGRYLNDKIREMGGNPVMSKTGHSIIKSTMRRLQADLGGELSGHIFMKERWFNFDDGIYVATRFLEILAASGGVCSQLFADIPQDVATPELKIKVSEEQKFQVMQQIIERADFRDGRVTTIDGLRVDYDYGFGLVRPSNTSPCLVACFAADNDEHLQQIKSKFLVLVKSVYPVAEFE